MTANQNIYIPIDLTQPGPEVRLGPPPDFLDGQFFNLSPLPTTIQHTRWERSSRIPSDEPGIDEIDLVRPGKEVSVDPSPSFLPKEWRFDFQHQYSVRITRPDYWLQVVGISVTLVSILTTLVLLLG